MKCKLCWFVWDSYAAPACFAVFVALCLLMTGCSTEPVIPVLNVDNQSAGTVRVVGVVPSNPADTLYDTTFPAGSYSCAILDRLFVRLHVIPQGNTGDTAAVSEQITMNARSVRIFVRPGLEIVEFKTRQPSC